MYLPKAAADKEFQYSKYLDGFALYYPLSKDKKRGL